MSWSSVCLVGEMGGVFFSMPAGHALQDVPQCNHTYWNKASIHLLLADDGWNHVQARSATRTPDKTSEKTSKQPWDGDASQWSKGWPAPAMCGILGKHQGVRQKELSRVLIDAR